MFIIDGLNYKDIGRNIGNKSPDTIRNWIRRYLPNLTYERVTRIHLRDWDAADYKEYTRLKTVIPKAHCQQCGSTYNLVLDHILPLYAGGKSTIDNLQWLCRSCHKKKTAKEIKQYKLQKPQGKNIRPYTKRLTSESHYEASIVLYRLLNNDIPEHITWEVIPGHIEILKAFIWDGLTTHEIARKNLILSKRGKPMSQDMIGIWLKRYLPNIEYDEKESGGKRVWDKEDYKAFCKYRRELPKTPCVVCGSTERLELDHIVTIYAGGRSEPANLQWLCHKCHDKKTQQERDAFGWSNTWKRFNRI